MLLQFSARERPGSAIDPVASMTAIENTELLNVARQVREMLKAAIDSA